MGHPVLASMAAALAADPKVQNFSKAVQAIAGAQIEDMSENVTQPPADLPAPSADDMKTFMVRSCMFSTPVGLHGQSRPSTLHIAILAIQ